MKHKDYGRMADGYETPLAQQKSLESKITGEFFEI